ELDRSKIRDVISENNLYNNVKCTSGDLSKYAQLKKKALNDLNLYKKLYEHIYSKKNILGKFDCYCEKSIFDMIDRIGKEEVETSSYDIKLEESIDRKWGIGTIVMCLFPFIGIILATFDKIMGGSFIPGPLYTACDICFTILTLIVLFFFIYTMTKVVKYRRLKAGKGKLNFRKYCLSGKNIFLPEGYLYYMEKCINKE
ncbi:CYIR protein, partial [Plasmodium cynomolgi strain B]